MSTLDERVRDYMESLGFCKFHRGLTGEDGFIRKGPSGPFISDEIAEISYLSSLRAQKNILIDVESNCYVHDCDVIDARIATLDQLMGTDQQPTNIQGKE
jgi:hypothetical protein